MKALFIEIAADTMNRNGFQAFQDTHDVEDNSGFMELQAVQPLIYYTIDSEFDDSLKIH